MLTLVVLSSPFTAGAVEFPGTNPGQAVGAKESQAYQLKNNLIGAEWSLKDGRLSAQTVKNLASGETLKPGGDLFGISLTKQQVDEDWGVSRHPPQERCSGSPGLDGWQELEHAGQATGDRRIPETPAGRKPRQQRRGERLRFGR